MNKVQAVKALLEKLGGRGTWTEIYDGIEEFYPKAKVSKFWQEGLRGVVYREIRYGRTFEFAAPGGYIGLKDLNHTHDFETQMAPDYEGENGYEMCKCGVIR